MPIDIGTPFRALDTFKQQADEALQQITKRQQFGLQAARQSREDALLSAVTSKIKEGKDIYDPSVAPLAGALASTSHANVLPFLEEMSKANRPKTEIAHAGGIPGYFDKSGQWHQTGSQVPSATEPKFEIKDVPLPNVGEKGQFRRDYIDAVTGKTHHSETLTTKPTETPERKLAVKDKAQLDALEVAKEKAVGAFPHKDYNLDDIILNGLEPANTPLVAQPDLAKGDAMANIAQMLNTSGTGRLPDDARKHAENALQTIAAYEAKAKQLGVAITPNKQRVMNKRALDISADPKGDKSQAAQLREQLAKDLLKETLGDKAKARQLADERGYTLE